MVDLVVVEPKGVQPNVVKQWLLKQTLIGVQLEVIELVGEAQPERVQPNVTNPPEMIIISFPFLYIYVLNTIHLTI